MLRELIMYNRIMGRFDRCDPVVRQIWQIDGWVECRHIDWYRWKHWNFVKIRRWFINHKLHRRRCSECHKLIEYYGYEGIYDMCTDCFYEAHPR